MEFSDVIHSVDTGKGSPAIVFIHGFTCDLTDWDAQTAVLSEKYRCVAVDMPGHGRTPSEATTTIASLAESVISTIVRKGLSRVVLVGHSMGCRVATEVNARIPERVRGIVYIDGSLNPPVDPELAAQNAKAHLDRVGIEAFIDVLYGNFFVPASPQGLREHVNRRRAHIDNKVAYDAYIDFTRWEAAHALPALRKVKVPVMLIQSTTLHIVGGERKYLSIAPDEMNPWLEAAQASVESVRMERIHGAGHFAMIEDVGRTNELIGGFVATL